MMNRVPPSGGHRPVEGERHDQDQAVEAVGVADLGVLDAEPMRFEVGEQGFNAPPPAILQSAQGARPLRHGDDPGLGMAGVVDDADVGPRPPGGEFDVLQGEDPISGAVTGRRLAGTVDDREVSLQAKPVAPASFLAPADQIGGAVEAIAHEPDRRPGREPRYDSLQKCPLHVEPDRAATPAATPAPRSATPAS